MAAKVTALFKRETVQDALCQAADQGLAEVIIVGKKPDGSYWVRISPCADAFCQLGMLEVLKHDLLTEIDERSA